MKPLISLNTHAVLDYVGVIVLLFCPSLFGFAAVDSARNLFTTVGFGLLGYSLFTNYRLSIARIIPLGLHMLLDVIAGLLLVAGPWLFDYRQLISGTTLTVHLVLGFGLISLVLLTRPRTEAERQVMQTSSEPSDEERRRAA